MTRTLSSSAARSNLREGRGKEVFTGGGGAGREGRRGGVAAVAPGGWGVAAVMHQRNKGAFTAHFASVRARLTAQTANMLCHVRLPAMPSHGAILHCTAVWGKDTQAAVSRF